MLKSSLEGLFSSLSNSIKNEQEYIELLENEGINTSEVKNVLSSTGKQMLLATAGSGKSTAIELKFIHDKVIGCLSENTDNRKVWITTFLKSGSVELEYGVRKRIHELDVDINLSGVSFKNVHSEFLELLRLSNVKHKVLEDNLDNGRLKTRIFKRLCKDYNLGKYPEFPTSQELRILEGVISRYRNTVISEFQLGVSDTEAIDMGVTNTLLPKIVEAYQTAKDRNEVIDIDDMLFYIYKYFANPETRIEQLYNVYVNRYKYIVIDEFQDTSELQYLALKPLFENCDNVIVVGDDDQSIYAFRGANPEVMKTFEDDFNPIITPISVSYRCPSNILNPMAKLIQNNKNRFDKPIRSFKEGGELIGKEYSSLYNMTMDGVRIIREEMEKGNTVSVLSRTNYDFSPIMVAYSFKYGGEFALRGDTYTLDRPRYKKIWSLIYLFMERGLENFSNNIRTIDTSIPRFVANRLEETYRNIVGKEQNIIQFFPTMLETLGSTQLYNYYKYLTDFIDSGVSNPMEYFKATLSFLYGDMFTLDADVIDTLSIITEYSNTVSDFMRNMDFVNNIIRGALTSDNSVKLTFATTHSYKGKQSDVSIKFNASDYVFPSRLSTEGDIEEERRNFFIGGTRSKKRQYYLCLAGRRSMFLDEAGIDTEFVEDVVSSDMVIKTNSELRKSMEEDTKKVDIYAKGVFDLFDE